jgi:hypothetical protein
MRVCIAVASTHVIPLLLRLTNQIIRTMKQQARTKDNIRSVYQETALFMQPEIKSFSQVLVTRTYTETDQIGSYSHALLL